MFFFPSHGFAVFSHGILFSFLCVAKERTKALELKYKLAMEDTWTRFVDDLVLLRKGGLKKCNDNGRKLH